MKHKATPDFWYHYRQLPKHIQNLADKCYDLLKQNPYYPSLHFKKARRFWTVRVGIHYRAIAVEDGDDIASVLDWASRRIRPNVKLIRNSTSLTFNSTIIASRSLIRCKPLQKK